MDAQKLVRMANQIGAYFSAQGEDEAPAAIADHLKKFWDPRMRREIVAHVRGGGDGLDPLVARAVELLPQAQEA
jgi:formate dehydrogenase subunit delta